MSKKRARELRVREVPSVVKPFPFSAVVGHDDAKLALVLNAIDPRIGGVLLRGQKGSAKSTLARGLAALLPGGAPFVELPIGATEDRVVGTIDIEAALVKGKPVLRRGLIADADTGVLYVDEVNLLPDHLVDVLLDVSASGVNRVEREGISAEHPARFVLVGSMNPEEGDLRPQLMDRFGLSVDVRSSSDAELRAEGVRRRMAYDDGVSDFALAWAQEETRLAKRIASAQSARISDDLVVTVASMCAAVGAEGLRADIVICRAAAALAGLEGKSQTSLEEVRRVAPFALSHRRRRGPFEEPGIDPKEIEEALGNADEQDQPGAGDARDKESPPAEADEPTAVVTLRTRSSTEASSPGGRRSPVVGRRGRLTGVREPDGAVGRLALGATVRAAAARSALQGGGPLVTAEDLKEAVHEERVGNLLVIAVDASGSMGVERRMEAVKGTVMSLLLDAYQRRDRVCLVTFHDEGAQVALRPTGSVEVARSRLTQLATGGRTPLAAGIEVALEVATRGAGDLRPLMVLVSDGRANYAPDGLDPLAAAYEAAAGVRNRKVPAVVVDVEEGPTRLGLAGELAERMGAICLTLPQLSAGSLAGALREVVVG